MKRCSWVDESNSLYMTYHDMEWGKPLHDDQKLFEFLCMEMYQTGLSWNIVLAKREAFRNVFYDYDITKVSQMPNQELDNLLTNYQIIRHMFKLYATRTNAQAFLKIQHLFGSFDDFIWKFVDYQVVISDPSDEQQLALQTALSETIVKELKRYGFKGIGPVVVRSFLQASGLVNAHENACSFKKR